MRVERELMRGAGPVAVLKLLETRGEMYGYELVETLARQSDGVLAMGQSTLYPLLYNLQAKGLVKATWREGVAGDANSASTAGNTSGAGGGGGSRDRKYYALTDKGRTRIAAESKQWNALARAMMGLGVIDAAAMPAKGKSKAVPA